MNNLDKSHELLMDQLQQCKSDVWRFTQAVPGPFMSDAFKSGVSDDAIWLVSHPINEILGAGQVMDQLYLPLVQAFPDLERTTDIFFAGVWKSPDEGQVGYSPPHVRREGLWVTTTGHYKGTFHHPFLGIPSTSEPAYLRFGEFYKWEVSSEGRAGRIVEARVLLDLVDLARQAGVAMLPPSSGLDILVPGPSNAHGILLDECDPLEGLNSMNCTLNMIRGLFDFDGVNLESMGMERFWHPNMMWYGPCGIGTTRGVGGFQKHHQKPFLQAFPDRRGAGHRARFAEGPFVASTGWPSVIATHRGPYLGASPSHQSIGMRVADWWRCEKGLLTENWVLIDLPHLFLQFGIDLFAKLKS
jgi:hypothetical protein